MKSSLFLIFTLASLTTTLSASPTPPPNSKHASVKAEKKNGKQPTAHELAESANGWTYQKGEWVHPDGYKYANGKILRTTAKTGRASPKPPGKLALANPEKLTATASSAVENPNKTAADKTAADKAAEKARNLAPRPAPQTGTHL